ncbi:MAG TPA: four helix bundle protein [Verrucomicrobiae bacterium]|jgi:four helix bundle protein|nr:four helix bundle protein [Verrucomicrobiae bacterium]
MAKIERFEDMLSWQKARELTRQVYALSKKGDFARDFDLRSQMRSAAASVMSNIAEGFERGGDKEFLQFLSTAKASCGEVRSQLYVALDQAYISPVEFNALSTESVEVSRLISGFMGYLQKSDLRGNKFKRI